MNHLLWGLMNPFDVESFVATGGLVGLCVGLGFGGIMSLLMFVFSFFGFEAGPDPEKFYLVSVGGAAAFTVAIVLWHRKRRTLRGFSKGKRATVAVLMWLLSVAYVVFFTQTLTI